MIAAGGLWPAVLLTLAATGLCAAFILRRIRNFSDEDMERERTEPDLLETEHLDDYFAYHSRSFSFAARFFTTEQYRLVTRLYAFL